MQVDRTAYSEEEQQHDTESNGEENPSSPNVGVEPIVKIGHEDSREHHGLRQPVNQVW